MRVFVVLLVALTVGPAVAQDNVWWEGEDAAAVRHIADRSPFAPGSGGGGDFSMLSGGDWLSGVVSGRATGNALPLAEYEVEVPADGSYALWARVFWRHGPFEWRFDDRPWVLCGRDRTLADKATIRTHLEVNWAALGQVELTAGKHRFQWRLTGLEPGKDEAFGFDAFVLSAEPFTPRGKLKPDARDDSAAPGWFVWDPPADRFPDDAGFDLRSLNESEAGVNGRVRREGAGFVLGDGSAVRFWGVNMPVTLGDLPDASLRAMARGLAKQGVNLVRVHSPLWRDDGPRFAVDDKKLDQLHRLVAAFANDGIYTHFSGYFPVWVDAKRQGFTTYADAKETRPFAAIYLDEQVQAAHAAYLRDVLTAPNPHRGGRPLVDDPALAFVELVNEDSLFFWTFNPSQFPAPLRERVNTLYRASRFYQRGDGDVPGVWHFTAEGLKQASSRQRAERGRQAAFLARTQRGFYADAARRLRDAGYGGLVVASNWTTADGATLDAIERWTYTATDVIDAHGYFEPVHEGEAASYAVRVGHRVGDRLSLDHLGRLPVRVHQVAGFPQMLSEVNWPLPNRYRADMALLGAAALRTQGVDAVCWFSVTTPRGVEPTMNKFTLDRPSVRGAFPLAALLYRRGDIAEATPAVVEPVKVDDVLALRGSASAGEAALDAFRAADVPAGVAMTGPVTALDARLAYLGAVVRAFDGPASSASRVNVAGLIDGRGVRTADGRVRYDTAHGRVLIDAPRVAAAAGRFDGVPVTLGVVTLRPGPSFDYGLLGAIALDDAPLADSARVLLQANTEDRPYGYRVGGGVIADLGRPPLNVRQVDASVELRLSGGPWRATALDAHGNRAGSAAITVDGPAVRVVWPAEALYVLLER